MSLLVNYGTGVDCKSQAVFRGMRDGIAKLIILEAESGVAAKFILSATGRDCLF